MRCLFCISLMAIYWVCEVIPLAVTALLPIALFPIIGILDSKAIAKEYLNDTNFLFIGGLMIAIAVEKCGLHERIGLRAATLLGPQAKCMFISNTATTAMMLPITNSITTQLIQLETEEKLTKSELDIVKGLILCIAFAANIGGIATINGTPPNLVFMGQLETMYPQRETGLSYLTWMIIAFPLMLFCLAICWLFLWFFFLRNISVVNNEVLVSVEECYAKLPRMSFAEKIVLVCFVVLIALWVFREPQFAPGLGSLFPKGYYSDATSAVLIAILLFALPDDVPDILCFSKRGSIMDWKTVQTHFPWNIVLLLGGGFALASGIKSSGLSDEIGGFLSKLKGVSLPILQFSFIIMAMATTNLCSNTATASIFLPIIASLAENIKVHPFTLMLPVTMACSFAFALPIGTPPNAIAFSCGKLKVSDMVTLLFVLCGTIISVVLAVILLAYFSSFAYLIFPLSTLPTWALSNSSSFANV
ncbi:unnamed protein product [Dracunculus medinensis]|uniref:CitMHS domain-containing protein n=1 Tax=Dracunculus medinensis TaxID=318479 RepID=A0A0N4UKR0_DRAME|nr:unnamed protein product [Dracunculus medinensis]